MYTAIYRDFRPNRFEEIIGQDHIVKILKNQLLRGQTGHAYLFCGTRGTGKTTTARILAKALNCIGYGQPPCCECESCKSIKDGSFIDVVEIDAASNNSVEDIRNLCESVNYPPIMGKCKIYIIDEVHMLSGSAFNALLKTLEEPPDHVVFILATTEVYKLPATILSRCMRLDFRRVSERKIIENMKMICNERKVECEDAALSLIASNADGSVRDSLSILEQCISGSNLLTLYDTAEILGAIGEEKLTRLTDMVMQGDIPSALLLLNEVIAAGRDVKQIMRDWLSHFRNLLVAKFVQSHDDMLSMSKENIMRIEVQSKEISVELLNRGITELTKTIADAKWSVQPRALLEMCVVRLSLISAEPSQNSLQIAENKAAEKVQNELPQEFEKADIFDELELSNFDVSNAVQSFEQAQTERSSSKDKDTLPLYEDNYLSDVSQQIQDSQESDLSTLWHGVVSQVLRKKPNLIRIETRTTLTKLDEQHFYVDVTDDNTKTAINRYDGKELMEEFMSKSVGRPVKMVMQDSDISINSQNQDRVNRTAEQISDILGVDVKIK